MFEVKKGVPVPDNTRGRDPIYPFAKMEVGSHFDAPRDMGASAGGTDNRQNSMVSCARNYAKRKNPDAKFTTRIIDDNTVRCWRVK